MQQPDRQESLSANKLPNNKESKNQDLANFAKKSEEQNEKHSYDDGNNRLNIPEQIAQMSHEKLLKSQTGNSLGSEGKENNL